MENKGSVPRSEAEWGSVGIINVTKCPRFPAQRVRGSFPVPRETLKIFKARPCLIGRLLCLSDWAEEAVAKAEILRLIYQGRFLHSNVTLGALGLPFGKTTVMHLVSRENLPEPNSQGKLPTTSTSPFNNRPTLCTFSC